MNEDYSRIVIRLDTLEGTRVNCVTVSPEGFVTRSFNTLKRGQDIKEVINEHNRTHKVHIEGNRVFVQSPTGEPPGSQAGEYIKKGTK